MNIEAINHFKIFVKEFVPASHKQDWLNVLDSTHPKFDDIEPHDIWPLNNNEIPNCSIMETSYLEFMRNDPYIKYRNNVSMVVPCGHDEKEASYMPLKDVMGGGYYLLEGLISINLGKLVLLVNHDGEVCIFNKL